LTFARQWPCNSAVARTILQWCKYCGNYRTSSAEIGPAPREERTDPRRGALPVDPSPRHAGAFRQKVLLTIWLTHRLTAGRGEPKHPHERSANYDESSPPPVCMLVVSESLIDDGRTRRLT